MKEDFIRLLAFSAITVLLSLLVRESRLERSVKLALGVLLLSVTVSPLWALISDPPTLPKLPDGGASLEGGDYLEVAEQAFACGVERYIADSLSLSEEDIEIFVSGFDFDSMRAGSIRVLLSGRAIIADRKRIEEMLLESGICDECRCDIEL